MMTCPFCRAQIPDDSCFCDLCGKELKFCPECGKPKRGTQCAECGADLVSAEEHFKTSGGSMNTHSQYPSPESTAVSPSAVPSSDAPVLFLVGQGLRLQVREGIFGRRGGMYPEFSAFPFISGIHGRFELYEGEWVVTDLGSTNGTCIYGKRLESQQMYYLEKGSTLRIATYDFTIE